MKYIDPRLLLLLMVICIILLCQIAKGEELVWDNLTPKQKAIAQEIYFLAKPYNLELTLVSIAWQESRLGLIPINLQDPSCGVHHIHITYYLKQHKLKDTAHNRNKYCNALIEDIELSTASAIETLLFFKKYHKGNYSLMIKSYNAGFNTHLAQADTYYKQVYHNVKVLKNHIEELETNTEMGLEK